MGGSRCRKVKDNEMKGFKDDGRFGMFRTKTGMKGGSIRTGGSGGWENLDIQEGGRFRKTRDSEVREEERFRTMGGSRVSGGR
jgi:hypothetical protein